MEKQENIKKVWLKPSIESLNIKKDTFNGTGIQTEKKPNQGPTSKKP